MGHEDGILFALVDKVSKVNEGRCMLCRVLDSKDCEGKTLKGRNHMVDEET